MILLRADSLWLFMNVHETNIHSRQPLLSRVFKRLALKLLSYVNCYGTIIIIRYVSIAFVD
jgi:hypothetical protein